jgi:hypothetical protein
MSPSDRIALRIYANIALNVGAGLCASLAILIMTNPSDVVFAQWYGHLMGAIITGAAFRIGFAWGSKRRLSN